MLTSFEVENFRCFRKLKLDDFDRVNLIAGKNNVGKTALLEAMHLHSLPNRPRLWIRVHKWRGIKDPFRATLELAAWLPRESQGNDRPIVMRTVDRRGVERTTRSYVLDPATSREKFPKVERSLAKALPGVAGSIGQRLILRHEVGGKQFSSIVVLSDPKPALGYPSIEAKIPDKLPNVFLGSLMGNARLDIKRFGKLAVAKRLKFLQAPLKILEPRLKGLSLIPFGAETAIHADIAGLQRLVPIPLVGEGMRRLLSVLLAIVSVRNGLVFIDEIENGLHYSVHRQVWKAIADAARRSQVQVFATTHSWECLRAAHEAFSEDRQYDFRMHRLEREEDGITVVNYDREKLEASLAMGLEVR